MEKTRRVMYFELGERAASADPKTDVRLTLFAHEAEALGHRLLAAAAEAVGEMRWLPDHERETPTLGFTIKGRGRLVRVKRKAKEPRS